MPYKSKRDLPAVAKALPSAAQSIFRSAFNAAYEQYEGDDSKAMAVAWAAVKRKYKKAGGEWVAKDSEEPYSIEMVGVSAMLLDANDMRLTSDGFLVATPRIARTGIQKYRGIEVGKPDMDWVNVYRPEDQVFAEASMRSWAHRPVTNDHPPCHVDASNCLDYMKGHTNEPVVRDGQFVRVPLIVMDGKTVDDVHKGKRELSGGYKSELVFTTGIVKDGGEYNGQSYDASQTNVRGNHVATCFAARGGPLLCIGDSFEPFSERRDASRRTYSHSRRRGMRTVTVDSVAIEFDDDTQASVVSRYVQKTDTELNGLRDQVARLTTDAAGAKTAHDTQVATLNQTVQTKDGEITALKQQLKDAEITPEKMDAAVNTRADIIGRAKQLVGDSVDFKGLTDIAIKRGAVTSKLGPDKVKAMSDAEVHGAFIAYTNDSSSGASPTTALGNFFSAPANNYNDAAAAAWEANNKKTNDAWKNAK